MESRYFIHDSSTLTMIIYDYFDDWNDKLQFSCLNTKVMELCFNQQSSLIYNLHSKMELDKRYCLPISTAVHFSLNDNINVQQKLINSLIKKVPVCNSITINISYDINIRSMEKISKTCAKRGVVLIIEKCPQKETFEKIAAQKQQKFDKLNSNFSVNRNLSTCIRSKRNLVETPIDPVKRLKMYLSESYKLAECIHSNRTTTNEDSFAVPNFLRKVISPGSEYVLFKSRVNERNTTALQHIINKEDIDEHISAIGKKFVNCFITFDKHIIYVTSIDIFIHNNPELDDCAYGIDPNEYYRQPNAIITEKHNVRGVKYYELSVFWGLYEFLVVGGYYGEQDGTFTPFLGSSLAGWSHSSLENGSIYQSSTLNDIICTKRLLIQYNKRDSIRPFGLHYLPFALRGFSPIIPVQFLNHQSQQHKNTTLGHFASKLLLVLTSRQKIQSDTVNDLFVFFSTLKEFQTICPNNNDNCIDFTQFREVWLQKETKRTAYMELLVEAACLIESKFKDCDSCFLSSAFKADELSKITLGIMKSGLKVAILYQNEQLVKKEKKYISSGSD